MQYREFVQTLQDPPTRQNVFAYAVWKDAIIVHLDLSAMQRFDAVDHSRLSWLEARYHWSRIDLALQWQLNGGADGTVYYALPQWEIWQTLMTYCFRCSSHSLSGGLLHCGKRIPWRPACLDAADVVALYDTFLQTCLAQCRNNVTFLRLYVQRWIPSICKGIRQIDRRQTVFFQCLR
jgi:hypothetical protein